MQVSRGRSWEKLHEKVKVIGIWYSNACEYCAASVRRGRPLSSPNSEVSASRTLERPRTAQYHSTNTLYPLYSLYRIYHMSFNILRDWLRKINHLFFAIEIKKNIERSRKWTLARALKLSQRLKRPWWQRLRKSIENNFPYKIFFLQIIVKYASEIESITREENFFQGSNKNQYKIGDLYNIKFFWEPTDSPAQPGG